MPSLSTLKQSPTLGRLSQIIHAKNQWNSKLMTHAESPFCFTWAGYIPPRSLDAHCDGYTKGFANYCSRELGTTSWNSPWLNHQYIWRKQIPTVHSITDRRSEYGLRAATLRWANRAISIVTKSSFHYPKNGPRRNFSVLKSCWHMKSSGWMVVPRS